MQDLLSRSQTQAANLAPLFLSNTWFFRYLLGAAWSLELSDEWKSLTRDLNLSKDTRRLQTFARRAEEGFQKGTQSSGRGGAEGKFPLELLQKGIVVSSSWKTFASSWVKAKSLVSNTSEECYLKITRFWIFRRTKGSLKVRLHNLVKRKPCLWSVEK